MSVKKRLFWSHILMFALPLAAYWGLSRLLDALLLRYLLAQNYASLWDFQRQVGGPSRWDGSSPLSDWC